MPKTDAEKLPGLQPVQAKILKAVRDAGGRLSVQAIKSLYDAPGDGQRVAHLINRGLIEWERRWPDDPSSAAVAARITEAGLKLFGNEK